MKQVVKQIEEMKKEGEEGRKIINKYKSYGKVIMEIVKDYEIQVGLK